MAEEVGFEPTEPFGPTVFKTVAINRSATLQRTKNPAWRCGCAWWRHHAQKPLDTAAPARVVSCYDSTHRAKPGWVSGGWGAAGGFPHSRLAGPDTYPAKPSQRHWAPGGAGRRGRWPATKPHCSKPSRRQEAMFYVERVALWVAQNPWRKKCLTPALRSRSLVL